MKLRSLCGLNYIRFAVFVCHLAEQCVTEITIFVVVQSRPMQHGYIKAAIQFVDIQNVFVCLYR